MNPGMRGSPTGNEFSVFRSGEATNSNAFLCLDMRVWSRDLLKSPTLLTFRVYVSCDESKKVISDSTAEHRHWAFCCPSLAL